MAEKSWKHENNERVGKLLGALGKAAIALQEAARYAADLSSDHVGPAAIQTTCLEMVVRIEDEEQMVRKFLV